MAKKPALARGLDSIFSDNTPSDGGSGGVLKLRISDVEPKSDQPRKDFDPEALSQLADSIAANGVLQPILVREVGSGRNVPDNRRRAPLESFKACGAS